MRGWIRGAATATRPRTLILVVLGSFLAINTALYYVVGPGGHARPRRAASVQLASKNHSIKALRGRAVAAFHPDKVDEAEQAGTLPGGADAELLCVDRAPDCQARGCDQEGPQVTQWLCKDTCKACNGLQSLIQGDTGLQLRIVRKLGPCRDLHPLCRSWQEQGKCDREPGAMLELCQEACMFCIPRKEKEGDIVLTSQQETQQDEAVPPMCSDDISVCAFLARAGMCESGSHWVQQQCPRSCQRCQAGPTFIQGGISMPPGPSQVEQEVVFIYGTNHVKAGSLVPDGGLMRVAVSAMPMPSCQDKDPVSCRDWTIAGECDRNPDSMMAVCTRSCGGCYLFQIAQPLRYRQLNTGFIIPAIGFGTAGLGDSTGSAVTEALLAGYRMFDSAESRDWYREDQVGEALSALGFNRGPRRSEVFLISKLHPRDHGYDSAKAAVRRSLRNLQTDYLDLFMLHYPKCSPRLPNCNNMDATAWHASWQALEDLYKEGVLRSIGASNFLIQDLRELLHIAAVKPAVVENHSDPLAANTHVMNFCLQQNITFIGYSTLGTQWMISHGKNAVLTSPTIKGISNALERTPAEVALRWALQRGEVIIPRATGRAHLEQNLNVHDLQLSPGAMAAMNALDGTFLHA